MHDSSPVLCIELDSTQLTATINDSLGVETLCLYSIQLQTTCVLLDDSQHNRLLSEIGNKEVIRCIAKGLDQLFEELQSSHPSTIGELKAIVIISNSTLTLRVDDSFGTFLTTLEPHDRLEQQILDSQAWQSAKSRAFLESSFASSKASVVTIPITTLIESFLVGAFLPYNVVQAAHCNLLNSAHMEREGRSLLCEITETRPIGAWIINRFGANSNCLICSSLPSHLAAYMTFFPSSQEGGLSFAKSDYMIVPNDKRQGSTKSSDQWIPNPLYLLNMTSTSTNTNYKPWLLIVELVDAGHVRDIIRKTYTKTWNAFDQLVYAVCPGGSVGLDNKLFSFYMPNKGTFGVYRYENGTQTSEFTDLRANPRCIVEGQALTLRGRLYQMQAKAKQSYGYTGAAGCLGFNPRNKSLSLPKWYAWGETVTDSILDVYTQVLGAPIYTISSIDEADGGKQAASRASIGATYYAIYLLHQHNNPTSPLSFRDCIESPIRNSSSVEPQRSKPRRRSFLPIVQEGDADLEQGAIMESCERHPKTSSQVTQRVRSCTITPKSTWDGSAMRQYISSPIQSPPLESSYREMSKGVPSRLKRFQSDSALRCSIEGISRESLLVGSKGFNQDNLIKVAEPDDDLWEFYAALLEENLRLSSMIEYNDDRSRY